MSEAEDILPGEIAAGAETVGDVTGEDINIPEETIPEISESTGNIELPVESADLPEEFEEELPISEEIFEEETVPEEDELFEDELLAEDELISLEDELLPQEELTEEAEAVGKPEKSEESEEEEILTDAEELECPEAVGAYSGKCGASLTWSLSTAGKLTVSGTGEMYNYRVYPWDTDPERIPPWFQYRDSIKELVIKSGVTSIGAGSFMELDNLKKVTIPNTVRTIIDYAFKRCTALDTVTIPDSVTRMYTCCFFECTSLKTITIPGNAQLLGGGQFGGCSSLETATIKPGSIKELPGTLFAGCTSLTSVSLPDNIEVIDENCFGNCPSLKNIAMPRNLKSIGRWGFVGAGMTELVLNSGLESTGPYAFALCYWLNSVKISVGETAELGAGIFGTNPSLTHVSIDPGISVLPPNMFNSCRSLSEVDMPMSGVTDIEYNAFYNCASLKKIDLPASLKRIGAGAFDDSGLETICFFGDAPSVKKVTGNLWKVDYLLGASDNPNLSTSYSNVFTDVKGFAFYPKNNSTWTEAGMKGYGGDIIWIPWEPGNTSAYGDRILSKMSFDKDGKVSRGYADGTQKTVTYYHPTTKKLSKTVFAYNGKDQRPEVILKTAGGNDIGKKHYTVTYPSSSKDIGTYTVTVKLKGDYAYGTIKLEYQIVPAKSQITALYNADQGIDVRWKKVDGATGYKVFRKRPGEGAKMVALIKDGNTVQCIDTAVKDGYWGKAIRYYVRAVKGSYVGNACEAVLVKRLAKMKFTSYKSPAAGEINVKWTLAQGKNHADGYEIQYAYSNADLTGRKGTFAKVNVPGKDILSRTIKNLQSGKTCFLRVRAYVYNTDAKDSKSYSKYSDIVSVKIK